MQTTTTIIAPKVYVEVKADFRPDGLMLTRELIWENGEKIIRERVTDVRQTVAIKAGGHGDRYTIKVRGHKSYLFFERSPNLTGNKHRALFLERCTG